MYASMVTKNFSVSNEVLLLMPMGENRVRGTHGDRFCLFLFYSFISRDCPIASVLWLCLEDRPQRQEIQRFESGDNVLHHTQPPLEKSNLCS